MAPPTLAKVEPPRGLCDNCAFCRRVESPRSAFYLCERSLADPAYLKYPTLPVVSCPGYQRRDPPGR